MDIAVLDICEISLITTGFISYTLKYKTTTKFHRYLTKHIPLKLETQLMTRTSEDDREKESTTFTYYSETKDWLLDAYPDAISVNEALRHAISDARLVRDGKVKIEEDS